MLNKYPRIIFYFLIILIAACETPPVSPQDPLEGSWVLVQGDLNYKGVAGFIIEKSGDNYRITLGEHQQQGFAPQGTTRTLAREGDIYIVSDPDLFHMEIYPIETGLEVRIIASDNSERVYRYERKAP